MTLCYLDTVYAYILMGHAGTLELGCLETYREGTRIIMVTCTLLFCRNFDLICRSNCASVMGTTDQLDSGLSID